MCNQERKMQIIANNIAILWENKFSNEHVINYFVSIKWNKQNIAHFYTNKKLSDQIKLTLIKKIRLGLRSTGQS
jgi:hypothetical protein